MDADRIVASQPVDYGALAQSVGGSAAGQPAVDYGALAAQVGGRPADQQQTVQDAQRGLMNRQIMSAGPFGAATPDVVFGARQVLDSLAQLAARGAEKISPDMIRGLLTNMRQDTEATNQGALDQYNANFQPDSYPGAPAARAVGQGIVTAPVIPAMEAKTLLSSALGGAASGGAAGALTPVYNAGNDFWSQKGDQVAQSAKIGAALGPLANVAGRVLSPSVSAAQKSLIDEGVTLTPGQAAGGIWKGLEDRMSGFPVIGDLIKNSQFNGITDFNRAVYAKALSGFGDEGAAVAAKADVGRAGIKDVGDFLSAKYEQALSQSAPSVLDPQFGQALNKIADMVPARVAPDFADVINKNVISQVTPAGTLTPSVAKAADSEIGRLAASYKGSSVASERELGMALSQAQTELRDMVARNNPNVAPMIQAADQGWRTIVQMENAGAMLGAKDGIFSPAQFLNAVKRSDTSVRDRTFARGDAWNQDFATAGDSVLPNKVPDSGTAGRLAAGALFAEGAHALSPELAIGGAAMALPYLPGLRGITLAALTKRPQAMNQAGDLVKLLAPYAGYLASPSP